MTDPTSPWRILALPPIEEGLVERLVAPLGEAAALVPLPSRDTAGLHAALAAAEIVVGDWSGRLRLDAAAVAAAPRLAFVQMPAVGVDSLDVDALTAAGIPLANTAGANARSVAEWAVGAAFALCRHLAWADRRVREGGWPTDELAVRGLREIHTQRVGILGFGSIGQATAALFAALGSPVSYWSRTVRASDVATYRSLEEVLAGSDILVITLPRTPQTIGLLDVARLALLPPSALIVNVARGGILDEDALLAALGSGALGGAALDVFAQEPPAADSSLRRHEGILLSPHMAGSTRQALGNIVTAVVDNIVAAVRGQPVRNVVNGIDPTVRRR
jgi:phosphoglycerate dehydrogenase-like enzyme